MTWVGRYLSFSAWFGTFAMTIVLFLGISYWLCICLLTHCQAHFWRPLRHGVWCGLWYLERGWRSLWDFSTEIHGQVRVRFGICTYKSRVDTFLNYTVLFCILVWYTMGCWDCWNPRIGMIPDSGPVGSPHFPRYPGWPSDEQVPWLRFWRKSFWKNLPFISRSVLADFMIYI